MKRIRSALGAAGLFSCLLLLASCAGFGRYSLEQAEEVATSFEHVRKLPPKSSADILQRIKAAQQSQGSKEQKVLDFVASDPPKKIRKDKTKLIKYYRKRSAAAQLAGRLEQALADIKRALDLISPSDGNMIKACVPIYCSLQYRLGEYADAVETMERMVQQYDSWNNTLYLAYFAAGGGDAAKAKHHARSVISKFERCKYGCPPAHLEYWAKYIIAGAEGDWREAAVFADKAVQLVQQNEKMRKWAFQLGIEFLYNDMVLCLMKTGQLVRAENQARRHFSSMLDRFGPYNWTVLEALESLARVRLARGRAEDAEQLFRKELELLEEIKTPEDTLVMARARYALGKSLAAQGRMRAAAQEFLHVKRSLIRNSFLYGKIFAADADVLAVMIETGAPGEALAMLDEALAH